MIDAGTGALVGDRDLDAPVLPKQEFYFCLEEVSAALHASLNNVLQRLTRETLKPTGHVFERCAKHEIGKNGPGLADHAA